MWRSRQQPSLHVPGVRPKANAGPLGGARWDSPSRVVRRWLDDARRTQDYLGDVLTEELTTSLSRLPGSFVVSRTTAFAYRDKAMDVKDIGKELGVRYVLEGSAERSGQRVRVSAQLIDAATGAHLWADQFDADQGEMLEMQDEIVTRLARALQIELAVVEASRVVRVHPNPHTPYAPLARFRGAQGAI